MLSFKQKGNFSKTERFLERNKNMTFTQLLNEYGQKGVEALSEYTPRDTGKTAESWYYKIQRDKEGFSITWSNRNVVNGVNIALILQYGHGTRNGGYVTGVDYINPALRPIFDNFAEKLWREVTKS